MSEIIDRKTFFCFEHDIKGKQSRKNHPDMHGNVYLEITTGSPAGLEIRINVDDSTLAAYLGPHDSYMLSRFVSDKVKEKAYCFSEYRYSPRRMK